MAHCDEWGGGRFLGCGVKGNEWDGEVIQDITSLSVLEHGRFIRNDGLEADALDIRKKLERLKGE